MYSFSTPSPAPSRNCSACRKRSCRPSAPPKSSISNAAKSPQPDAASVGCAGYPPEISLCDKTPLSFGSAIHVSPYFFKQLKRRIISPERRRTKIFVRRYFLCTVSTAFSTCGGVGLVADTISRVYSSNSQCDRQRGVFALSKTFFRRNTDVFQGKMARRSVKRPAVRVRWELEEYTLGIPRRFACFPGLPAV